MPHVELSHPITLTVGELTRLSKQALRTLVRPVIGRIGRASYHVLEKPPTWAFLTAEQVYEELACPFGTPGDRLWVRERFAPRADVEPNTPKALHYMRYFHDGGDLENEYHHYEGWRAASRMPQWASRHRLLVREVGVAVSGPQLPWDSVFMQKPPWPEFGYAWILKVSRA